MIIEKVLNDRMSVVQVDSFSKFINMQFLSCYMMPYLCYVCH
jgi:hypothetical protein